MKDTTFYLTEKQLPRLAKSYRRTAKGELEAAEISFLNGKSPTDRDRFPAPNGGLFSTAADYARFCQMILRGGELDGKRYLKPETVKLMTTVQTGDLKTGFTPGNGWGLGWCVVREPQGVTAMLSKGSFGHGGAYGTQAWIDPAAKRVYILMVQRANFPNSDDSEVRKGFQEAAAAAFSGLKGDEKAVPRKESIDEFKKAEAGGKAAEVAVDLVVNESVRLPVTALPIRVVTDDADIASHSVEVKPAQELVVRAKKAGRTNIDVTFGDPPVKGRQFTVTVRVSVRPKP
jgi:hypothetical protein